jgi:hypothetical protein
MRGSKRFFTIDVTHSYSKHKSFKEMDFVGEM